MKIKTWLGVSAICSLILLSACGNRHDEPQQADSAPQTKTYIVGTNAEFAPFESHASEGELTGFDIDIMRALAKNSGLNLTFKDQPWDSLFASLNNGDLDSVISGVTITDERKQTMDFTDPYFTITQVVLMPEGKTPVHTAEDLKTQSHWCGERSNR